VLGPAMGMEFCLLGPLVVRCGGVVVPVAPGKQRAVLAVLLLNAGRVISVAELITLNAGELDITRFETLLTDARAAARARTWETAAARAAAALALWRGEPLADAGSPLLALREVPRLAEMRLQALETRLEAGLHLGQHREAICELRQLTSAHPLREHLHALLMLALHRDSRQGEALAAYQRARTHLASELGAEPGTRLRELHHQILTADPALAGRDTASRVITSPGGGC
jgi:DNA-binding SARP family transcriptional activator